MASDRGAMTGETNLERGPRGEENPAAARCSGFGPGFRRGSGRVGGGRIGVRARVGGEGALILPELQ